PRAVGAPAAERLGMAETMETAAGERSAGGLGRLRRTERNAADRAAPGRRASVVRFGGAAFGGCGHPGSLLENVLPDQLKRLGGLLRAVQDPDTDPGQLLLAEERELRGERLVVLVPPLDEAVALRIAVPRRLLLRIELAPVLLGVRPRVGGGQRTMLPGDARERLIRPAVPFRSAAIVGDPDNELLLPSARRREAAPHPSSRSRAGP